MTDGTDGGTMNGTMDACPGCGGTEFTVHTAKSLLGWTPHVEDGVEHSHDPNVRRDMHECRSCGSLWMTARREPCPACDYGSEPPTGPVLVGAMPQR